MAKLVVNTGTAQGREFELRPGVNSFGRAPACNFRLTDASVSAVHAEIIVEANSVTVKDLRSTNGTFINRSQIREGFLQPGQVVSLGGVEMLYVADAVESAMPSGGVARTVALPQVGGIKIARPGAALPGGAEGFRAPFNYPAPVMPTPSLTTSPTALGGGQQQSQASAAPVAEIPVEARTWKHVEAVRLEPAGGWRCFGFGLGAAVLSAAVWIAMAAVSGKSPAAYAAALTGLICGLALRMASRNHGAAEFSLLAAGFGLLGMFLGECGQALALQVVSFEGLNLAGLAAGLAAALLIGGAGSAPKAVSRTEFA